jgi:hypothetical protein
LCALAGTVINGAAPTRLILPNELPKGVDTFSLRPSASLRGIAIGLTAGLQERLEAGMGAGMHFQAFKMQTTCEEPQNRDSLPKGAYGGSK